MKLAKITFILLGSLLIQSTASATLTGLLQRAGGALDKAARSAGTAVKRKARSAVGSAQAHYRGYEDISQNTDEEVADKLFQAYKKMFKSEHQDLEDTEKVYSFVKKHAEDISRLYPTSSKELLRGFEHCKEAKATEKEQLFILAAAVKAGPGIVTSVPGLGPAQSTAKMRSELLRDQFKALVSQVGPLGAKPELVLDLPVEGDDVGEDPFDLAAEDETVADGPRAAAAAGEAAFVDPAAVPAAAPADDGLDEIFGTGASA